MLSNDTEESELNKTRSHTTWVDSHCHLDLAQFNDDRDTIVAHARESGVRLIVNPGIDLKHSQMAIDCAERYAEVYAAVGVHPNSSTPFGDEKEAINQIDSLRELAKHPKVVAIGEIGLDYHWDKVEPAVQKRAFQMQLSLAQEIGLPVIIHSRKSNDDVAHILREWVQQPGWQDSALAKRPFAGVLHAYSGDLALAIEAYSWGFVLSLGGPVTFKNAKELHTLVPQLRLDRLMLETDAPFLTPHPHRGKRNEPVHVKLVSQKLAELYGEPVQTIAAMSTDLAHRFFGFPVPIANADS
ncbi:MAG: TatD family hydrolase [Chloroflexota bacterium]